MQKKTELNNNFWKTPYLPTIPKYVRGVRKCSILQTERKNHDWQFLFQKIENIPSPYKEKEDYNFDTIENEKWQDVIVPGSLIMQGFDIENNIEYYYKRNIQIPNDFRDNRVFLRFEGVYSNARIWINNKFIKTHIGGFTPFNCDITEFAEENEITLIIGITDVEGENKGIWNPNGEKISNSGWVSYYAHNNVGGILRDITLYALPKSYIARTHINTVLEEHNKKATIDVDLEIHSISENMQITLELVNKKNITVARFRDKIDSTYTSDFDFSETKSVMNPSAKWVTQFPEAYENDNKYSKMFIEQFFDKPSTCKRYCINISMPVINPVLWDAEHPNLYKLKITLIDSEKPLQKNNHLLGIRSITYGGKNNTSPNMLYINGKEVKLRGVCRHDISHLYGRSLTKKDILNEILAYKRNNVNHIRTSHYPASDYFLETCDKLGMYVEQENSACFKGSNGFEIYNPPQDFVNSFAEMIESARNHSSIIIWSLGNESGFEATSAFRAEYDYAKLVDTTRPIIFSWPETVKTTPIPYDILAFHYKDVTSDLGAMDMPILHEEFAHIPCYNVKNLRHDNSSREFWGESIKKGWDNIFKTKGALGCDIWGGIDDVFYIPTNTTQRHQKHSGGKCAGYGEWGCILDGYKREKPEAYLTKKGYTPILLNEEKSVLENYIKLFISNRFDHTSLKEVKLVCSDENDNVFFDDYIKENIMPHTEGFVVIPNNKKLNCVNVKFYFADYLVDEYIIGEKNNKPYEILPSSKQSIHIFPTIDDIIEVKYNMKNFLKGIYFDVDFDGNEKAELQKIEQTKTGLTAEVICINKHLSEEKTIDKFHFKIEIKEDKAIISLSGNGKFPIINFPLLRTPTAVSWNKAALYSVYPKFHIARASGTALLKRKRCDKTQDIYGKKPKWGWESDMSNYFLSEENSDTNAISTNDFKTKRTNIYNYTVMFENDLGLYLKAISKNIGAYVLCKYTDTSNISSTLQISYGNYFPDIEWGNYLGEAPQKDEKAEMSFELLLIDECCEENNGE